MRRFASVWILMFWQIACAQHASPDALHHDLAWLASDAREGRAVGSDGAAQAAQFIEDRLRGLNLQAVPALKGYRQTFDLDNGVQVGPDNALAINGQALKLDEDFRPHVSSATARFEGSLAFAGYGVARQEAAYDDYSQIDVKDRVVLVMRYEPHDTDGKSRFTHGGFTGAAAIQAKARLAASHGAKALLVVNAPDHHPDDAKLLPWNANAFAMGRGTIPVLSITPNLAQTLVGNEHDLSKLQDQIDGSGKPASFLIDRVTVSGNTVLVRRKIQAQNVMALLPGKGEHKSEYILVGAHYDHIGHGDVGSRKPGSREIYNGADDNASGVSAALSVAEHFAEVGAQDRSLLFVFFTGEEMGLLGSRAFMSDCPIPTDQIAAMVNLDMVGRVKNDRLYVGGDGTARDFASILKEVDEHSPLVIKSIGRGGGGPSDHASFSEKKIPVLFFFSGLHPQYHRPDDDTELINFQGLAEVSDATADLVTRLAAMPKEAYVDRFDKQGINVNLSAGTLEPTDPGRMNRAFVGITMGEDRPNPAQPGAVLAEIQPGSPAKSAGLMPGDIVVQFAGVTITASSDLQDELSVHEPGENVEIRFLREGKLQLTTLSLAQRPGAERHDRE